METNEQIPKSDPGQHPVDQGSFLGPLESHLHQEDFYQHTEQAYHYVHKVKAAGSLDLTKMTRDNGGTGGVSYNFGEQEPPSQCYSTYSNTASVQEAFFIGKSTRSGESGPTNPGAFLNRDGVISPGALPSRDHCSIPEPSEADYSKMPLYDVKPNADCNVESAVQNDRTNRCQVPSFSDINISANNQIQDTPLDSIAKDNVGLQLHTVFDTNSPHSVCNNDPTVKQMQKQSFGGDNLRISQICSEATEARILKSSSGQTCSKMNVATTMPSLPDGSEEVQVADGKTQGSVGSTGMSEMKAVAESQDVSSDSGDESSSDESESTDDNDSSAESPAKDPAIQEKSTHSVNQLPAHEIKQPHVNSEQNKSKSKSKEKEKTNEIQTKEEEKIGDEQNEQISKAPGNLRDPSEFVTVSWFHFKCKFCSRTFQERKLWKTHLVKEHNVKPYPCLYCDERFEKKVLLKEHHRFHEQGGVQPPGALPPEKRVLVPKTEPLKPKVDPPKQKQQTKVKAAKEVSEMDTAKRKRGRPPMKKPTTRGRKKKMETEPVVKTNDPDFLPEKGAKSSRMLLKDRNSKHSKQNDSIGRNKRKCGPVYRYVSESYEPVKRKRGASKNIQCTQCSRTFSSNQARLVHEKSHKGYKCDDCGETFRLKRELKQHEASHLRTPKIQHKTLRNTSKKRKVSPRNAEIPKQDVEHSLCIDEDSKSEDDNDDTDKDYDVDTDDDDDNENDSDRDEGGPYKCSFCPRMIKKQRNLAKHEKTHENGNPHTCPHCNKVYTRRRDLRRHMVRHTEEKPYQCDKCKKRFKHDVGLRRHMRLHTGEGLLVCQFCGKKYNGKGSLKAHERIHTGEKPYKCHYCDKYFGTQTAQKYHEIEHTGALICHVCGRQFKSKHNLQEHERIHSGQRPYKCGRCDESFMSVGARRYHMNVHTGDEHWCDICSKQFTCKASLDAHKFTHSGLHPYGCKYCPKHFNSISGVRGHEKQVHLGMKRKHKTKAQKVLEKALIAQKKTQVNRPLNKKELKAISEAAKATAAVEQAGHLKPGRKPRDKQIPKNVDPSTLVKDAKPMSNTEFGRQEHKDASVTEYTVSHQKLQPGEEKQFGPQNLQGIPDIEYPTRVVIGDQGGQGSVGQAVPVDYSTTYVSSAIQKAIGLMPRVHNTPQHTHNAPWPTQHVGNSHLDTMVESLVQFSKNY